MAALVHHGHNNPNKNYCNDCSATPSVPSHNHNDKNKHELLSYIFAQELTTGQHSTREFVESAVLYGQN